MHASLKVLYTFPLYVLISCNQLLTIISNMMLVMNISFVGIVCLPGSATTFCENFLLDILQSK